MSTELYDGESMFFIGEPETHDITFPGLRNDSGKQREETETLLKSIRSLEADEYKLAVEIERLQGRKATLQRSIEYRRNLLASLLDYCNQKTIRTVIGTAYFVAPRKSLEIDTAQVANWPDAIQCDTNIVSYEVKVNKSELKGRYPKAYATLPGVEETEGERALAIKW